MSTTQLIGNNKQPTSKSTKYRRYHSAHQGSGRIQTKQPNPTPFEHHPTTNTLNQQTLNITNNNQTQTLHVTNMRPYTKHSKYKPRKPRTALVFFFFFFDYAVTQESIDTVFSGKTVVTNHFPLNPTSKIRILHEARNVPVM